MIERKQVEQVILGQDHVLHLDVDGIQHDSLGGFFLEHAELHELRPDFSAKDHGREPVRIDDVDYAISDGQDMVHLGKVMVPARAYAARFGFTGDVQQRKVGVMSGGERNRIHLARLIKAGANVLLLDEPTNDLDVNTIRALEDALEGFAGCAVIVTHDRWFLDRVATHILAFEDNSTVVWHEGNYGDYLEDRRKRLGLDSDTPRRPKYRRLTR